MSFATLRVFIFSIVALFFLILIFVSIRARKNIRSALPFAYLTFWVGISCWGDFVGEWLAARGQTTAGLWYSFSFGALLLVAPALLIFVLSHLRTKLGANFLLRLLLHLPAIALLPFVFTNFARPLFWNPALPFNQPGFYGPLYFPTLSIVASFVLTAIVMLAIYIPKTERIYDLQSSLFILGILAPLAAAVYTHLLKLPLFQTLDLVIASWTIMLLLCAFALLRLPLYGMLPIAQNELLRHVRDGFLITNSHQEVIFINPAAQKVLKISDSQALGKPLSELISQNTKKIIINPEMKHTSFELQVDEQYFHVNVSNIKTRGQNNLGQIVMIYDVTAQTEFANQFRELANKDALTNVYNRRYLLEQARAEFERARRYHVPFSIIMLDLDNLKRINDQYGHVIGDSAIQVFSATCQEALRTSDTIGRFGGDEFIALLPHTDPTRAVSIVDRLTSRLEHAQVDTGNGLLRLSASFGLTTLDETVDSSLEDMIKRADQALYLAKSDPKRSCASIFATGSSQDRVASTDL